MKKGILIGLMLSMALPVLAEEAKIYTERDLKKYGSATSENQSSYIRDTDRRDREEVIRLSKKSMEVISDSSISQKEKCDKLRDVNSTIDTLMANETNGDLLAAHARSKIHTEEMCRTRHYR